MKTTSGMAAIDRCAGVVDTCASRHVASPAFDNYFDQDPLRSLGMKRPEQSDETIHHQKGPFELEGFIEIDGTGTARLR